MGYIARVPRQLAMQAADYEAVLDLVRLMQASRSPDLARAFFRLDWDKDAVCLLHLHHLANPWDMPDSVVIDICAEVFRALVYVETERALGSDMSKIQVAFRGGLQVVVLDTDSQALSSSSLPTLAKSSLATSCHRRASSAGSQIS
jgi:hypothetical protein